MVAATIREDRISNARPASGPHDSFSANQCASVSARSATTPTASAASRACGDTAPPFFRRTRVCAKNSGTRTARNPDDGKTRDTACSRTSRTTSLLSAPPSASRRGPSLCQGDNRRKVPWCSSGALVVAERQAPVRRTRAPCRTQPQREGIPRRRAASPLRCLISLQARSLATTPAERHLPAGPASSSDRSQQTPPGSFSLVERL